MCASAPSARDVNTVVFLLLLLLLLLFLYPVFAALTMCLTVCVDPTLNTLNQPSKASLNRHGGGTSVKAGDWFCC